MQMKGKIRKYIPILMWTALLLAAGCGAPPVPPSDEEMTRHFLAHEAAFEALREVIARCPYGMYYPPYDTQDTACLKGISTEDRHRLDSLLAAISCERVFYYGKEAKKEAMKKSGWDGQDTTYTSLSVPYFSHGYSIGGTSKDFVYDPGLKDHPDGHVTEHGDLNEIYRRAYNDTTLYKRIKGDWYIQLEHDN